MKYDANPSANPRRFISIDPGLTSGVVFGLLDGDEIGCLEVSCVNCGDQWPHDEFKMVSWIVNFIIDERVSTIIIEDFMLRIGAHERARSMLSPARIGMGIYSCVHIDTRIESGREVIFQSPSSAKATFTDPRLQDMGCWIAGSDHARDAMRHYLLYRRTRKMATLKRFEMRKLQKITASTAWSVPTQIWQ